MIVSAFSCGSGDHIWLPHKFKVLSSICDRIFVYLDRCPQAESICKQYSKVQWRVWEPTQNNFPMAKDGPTWDEGLLRQAMWDWATECGPEYVLLADADEVPTPGIVEWIASGKHRGPNCWYADWVNLIHDAGHAIGTADNIWSFQNHKTNKKGMLVKYEKGRAYQYRTDLVRHVRMEPNPRNQWATVHNELNRLGPIPLVHYKWANWKRWKECEQSRLPYWSEWGSDASQIVDIDRSFLWTWDADELVKGLRGNIAVVGNGPVSGKGEEIDGHNVVIRFNNYVVDGYESHVGKRTDIWCVNCYENIKRRECTGTILSVTTDNEQKHRTSEWLGIYPHMHYPKQSWTNSARTIKENNPSTGLVLLNRLAMAGKQVDAYGFAGMRGGHYWDQSHANNHADETEALKSLSGRINFR